MELNDLLLLTDKYDIMDNDDVRLVQVRIIETRPVKGNYGSTGHTGYHAKDANDNDYYLNWNAYPDDAGVGSVSMWSTGHGFWYFATNRELPRRLCRKAYFVYTDLHWCTEHNELFYKACHGCEYGWATVKHKKKNGKIICS